MEELFKIFSNALRLSTYEDVINYFKSMGVEYEFTNYYDNPDPLYSGVTSVCLRKDGIELTLDTTDRVFHKGV